MSGGSISRLSATRTAKVPELLAHNPQGQQVAAAGLPADPHWLGWDSFVLSCDRTRITAIGSAVAGRGHGAQAQGAGTGRRHRAQGAGTGREQVSR